MDIEHPDITWVNSTGYTKDYWKEKNKEYIENEYNDECDKSEWDD